MERLGKNCTRIGHVPNTLSNPPTLSKISSELIELMRPYRYYRLIIFLWENWNQMLVLGQLSYFRSLLQTSGFEESDTGIQS
jgi:hypothetical protein